MSAEIIHETMNVCQYDGVEKKNKNVEGEIVLPDIKPDILSMVKMKGRVCLQKVETEENQVIIEGTLLINCVYIADDDAHTQRGVMDEIPFRETIDFPGVKEESIIRLYYHAGNVEYKVMNGRKIAIKVPIAFWVKAYQNSEINIVRGLTEEEGIEVQQKEMQICSKMKRETTCMELKENVQLSDQHLPIGEIVDSDVSIVHQEYKLSYQKILAKADAVIRIVYVTDSEEQSLESFETTLPLMGIIDMDAIDEKQEIYLDYQLKKFSVRPVYQDMQANGITVEMMVDVNAYRYQQEKREVITDMYTPYRMLSCETETNRVMQQLMNKDETIELSQMLVVPELENTKILSMEGDVVLSEYNVLNGKIAITGSVHVEVLFVRVANYLVESKRLELPFQQVIKIEEITQNSDPQITLSLEEIHYQQAGENQLQITILLRAKILSERQETIESIRNLNFSNEPMSPVASMVIYFVKPGDTLWNIAKKYHNKVEEIKAFNALQEDVIYPGQRLFIPRLSMSTTPTSVM